jgi:transcriptional regulator with PAS, ATPase and Fis domain
MPMVSVSAGNTARVSSGMAISTASDIRCPDNEHRFSHGQPLREIGRAAQEAAIQMVLTEEGGSVKRASQRLRVSDRALQMRRSAAQITSGR